MKTKGKYITGLVIGGALLFGVLLTNNIKEPEVLTQTPIPSVVVETPTPTPIPTRKPVRVYPTVTPTAIPTIIPTSKPDLAPRPIFAPLPTYKPWPTSAPYPTYAPIPTIAPLPTPDPAILLAAISSCKNKVNVLYNELVRGCYIKYGATSAAVACERAYNEEREDKLDECEGGD